MHLVDAAQQHLLPARVQDLVARNGVRRSRVAWCLRRLRLRGHTRLFQAGLLTQIAEIVGRCRLPVVPAERQTNRGPTPNAFVSRVRSPTGGRQADSSAILLRHYDFVGARIADEHLDPPLVVVRPQSEPWVPSRGGSELFRFAYGFRVTSTCRQAQATQEGQRYAKYTCLMHYFDAPSSARSFPRIHRGSIRTDQLCDDDRLRLRLLN